MVHITTGLLRGLEGVRVTVEVAQAKGLPAFFLVGLADTAVQEARKRVESAIIHSGYAFPCHKITVNLAPAHIGKRGALFDLPIALGIMGSAEDAAPLPTGMFVFGELSLSGEVRPVPGALGLVDFARKEGCRGVVLPKDNYHEVQWVEDIALYPVGHLREAVGILSGKGEAAMPAREQSEDHSPAPLLRMEDIKGHGVAKAALAIAVAGGHNVLMVGSPGTGKSLLAKAVEGILPPLSFEEALEVTKIYSLSGLLKENQGLVQRRPFRSIHATISPMGLVGGGSQGMPGEITLAHHGVLYVDEMGEFPRGLLEVLRQPMEEGKVAIARLAHKTVYPSSFQLIATTNPCPCGYDLHPRTPCRCTPQRKAVYRQKFSGPLLDRCDMVLQVESQSMSAVEGKTTAVYREQVQEARQRQRERQGVLNGQLTVGQMEEYCGITPQVQGVLEVQLDAREASGRAYHRILKVARTIADLAGRSSIEREDILEAIQYKYLFG